MHFQDCNLLARGALSSQQLLSPCACCQGNSLQKVSLFSFAEGMRLHDIIFMLMCICPLLSLLSAWIFFWKLETHSGEYISWEHIPPCICKDCRHAIDQAAFEICVASGTNQDTCTYWTVGGHEAVGSVFCLALPILLSILSAGL